MRGLRQCRKCHKFLPSSLFHKDATKKDGLRYDCISCRSIASKNYYNSNNRKEVVKQYVHKNRMHRRNNTLRYMYGISLDDYELLLKKQNGKCGICKKVESRKSSPFLCVDHCHMTGRIRGLLCHKCNSAIGKLNDDPYLLRRAIAWLEKA